MGQEAVNGSVEAAGTVPKESRFPHERLSYIDTLKVYFPAGISTELCHALLESVDRGDGKNRMDVRRRSKKTGAWGYTVKLHQPTLRTMDLLAKSIVPCRLVRLDVALDLIVRDKHCAERLWNYIVARFVGPGRVRRPLTLKQRYRQTLDAFADAEPSGDTVGLDQGTVVDGPMPVATAYFGRRETPRGNEIAMYWDRLTKTASRLPCMHVEWRIHGAPALRTAKVQTFEDVVALNHVTFWSTRLKLLEPPSKARLHSWLLYKGACANGRDSSELAVCVRREVHSLFLRSSICDNAIGCSQDLLYWLSFPRFSGLRVRRRFLREDVQWMIPGSELNAIWGQNL